MHKQTLEGLFESKIRTKVLKFFFRNSPGNFMVKDLSSMLRENRAVVKRELENLASIGLLKRKYLKNKGRA